MAVFSITVLYGSHFAAFIYLFIYPGRKSAQLDYTTNVYLGYLSVIEMYLWLLPFVRSSPDSPMEQELNAHDESDPVVPAETEASAVES